MVKDEKYQLAIKTINGNIIKVVVDKYSIKDGMISFFDPKFQCTKSFPISNCEIVVIS
jgi:hypothetical protein